MGGKNQEKRTFISDRSFLLLKDLSEAICSRNGTQAWNTAAEQKLHNVLEF